MIKSWSHNACMDVMRYEKESIIIQKRHTKENIDI